jgi:phenol 2-monooxygenase (NADPH)
VDDESYNSGHGHAYVKYGIDVEEGAVAIVRPDQCKLLPRKHVHSIFANSLPDVSIVTALDDHGAIDDFFEGFALRPTQSVHPNGASAR